MAYAFQNHNAMSNIDVSLALLHWQDISLASPYIRTIHAL